MSTAVECSAAFPVSATTTTPMNTLPSPSSAPASSTAWTRSSLTNPVSTAAPARTIELRAIDQGRVVSASGVGVSSGEKNRWWVLNWKARLATGQDEDDGDVEADRLEVRRLPVVGDRGVDRGNDQREGTPHRDSASLGCGARGMLPRTGRPVGDDGSLRPARPERLEGI
jgi:hypothetical protein